MLISEFGSQPLSCIIVVNNYSFLATLLNVNVDVKHRDSQVIL